MNGKIISKFLIIIVVLVVSYTIPTSASVAKKPDIGWYQINTDGFDDFNNQSAILIEFNGNLYATTYNWVTGANIFQYQDGQSWMKVTEDGFGTPENIWIVSHAVFNDELYVGTQNDISGTEIWRSTDGTDWSPVFTGGFGEASNKYINSFEMFDDKLFAGTANPNGGQLWYSVDGNDWLNANPEGFGDNNFGIWSIESFQDKLYVGVGGYPSSIWKSSDGITWTPVVLDGFGDYGNLVLGYAMKVFKNALYVTTTNSVTGGEVWRTFDGISWNQVNEDGFDGSSQNQGAKTLYVYRGDLYAGIRNSPSSTTVASLWKTHNGTDWDEVDVNAFEDPFNIAVWGLAKYQGDLIIGTQNIITGGEVWRFGN